jgi:hypothetical protein
MTLRTSRNSSSTPTSRTGNTQRPNTQTPTRSPQKKQQPADRFEGSRKSAPVALKPTETPQQERARRIQELHGKLNQVATAEPPLSEAALQKLLGIEADGKYHIYDSQLDATTRQGLFDTMRGIHRLGQARISISEGNHDVAKRLLDMDPKDAEVLGVINYRDAALSKGITHQELGPIIRASLELTQKTYGALSLEQEALNKEAGNSLAMGKQVSEYFLGKERVMSQGPIIQAACNDVVKYSGELEKALAMPLTDGNRAAAVKQAKDKLDANLRTLGQDPVNDLEKGRRGTIDGLNNTADLVGSVPTPVTRGAALLMRTTANGLEYASGDITGKQFALKEAGAIIDAAGGQITQRLGTAAKLFADAGFEFKKTLAAELGKIDPKLPANEQARLGQIAVRTALHNAVFGAFSDAIGNSFGEPGKKLVTELARTVTSGLAGTLSTAANEINKTLHDQSLSPEQKSAMIKESLWKGAQNVVKTASEGMLKALEK